MSHAVVLITIFPGIGIPAAIPVAGAMVLIALLMDRCNKAQLSSEQGKCVFQKIIHEIKTALHGALKHVSLEARKGNLSEKSLKAIEAEIEFLEKSAVPKALAEIEMEKISQDDISEIRNRIDCLEILLAEHQASFTELQKRSVFLSGKIEHAISDIRLKFQGKIPHEKMEEKLEKIALIADSQIERKVSFLSDFLAEIESISEGFIMNDIVQRILKTEEGVDQKKGKRPPPVSPASKEIEEFNRLAKLKALKNELEFYFEKLNLEFPEAIDEKTRTMAREAIEENRLQRLSAIRDQVKLLFQKNHSAGIFVNFFKKKLREFLGVLDNREPLFDEISKVLEKEAIDRDEFMRISAEFEGFLTRKMEEEQAKAVREKVGAALQKLDYIVLQDSEHDHIARKLAESKMALIETKYPDYKLLLRLGKDADLSLRLIRLVEQEKDKQVSDFQRQKDRDVKDEWCKNADRLKEMLAENGILTVEKLRVEDEVHYFTIEQIEQQKIDVSSIRKKKSSQEKAGPLVSKKTK